jgi:hypothetical protein
LLVSNQTDDLYNSVVYTCLRVVFYYVFYFHIKFFKFGDPEQFSCDPTVTVCATQNLSYSFKRYLSKIFFRSSGSSLGFR